MSGSTIQLPAREVPVVAKKDVVVVGAGPTGVPAAIAAARAGASTALIEQHGFVGGQLNQPVYFIGFLDVAGFQTIRGIPDEIIQRLVKLGASPGHIIDEHEISFTPLDPHMYNVVALQMLKEAGVELFLNSFFGDVVIEGGKIKAVVITNKSGYQAIEGTVFVDATGDADVAARAGAPFVKGRKIDGKMQPLLLWMTFDDIDWDKFRKALIENPELYDVDPLTETLGVHGQGMKPEYFQKMRYITFWGFRNLVKEAKKKGYKPLSNRVPLAMVTNRPDQGIYGGLKIDDLDGTNAQDVTRAEIELRLAVPDQIEFIRKCIPGWENAKLSFISPLIGVQDTRTIVGEYTLTEEDMMNSRRFPDVIAVAGGKVDDWDNYRIVYPKGNWDIPYRCLLPQKVQNLLVGGRCISADRFAMMSIRSTATCGATGQAAGIAAALSAKNNVAPRKVNFNELQRILLDQGSFLRHR